ncbi:hypothetical protein J7M23_09060 [Candidatus Sumerlaeota bacterium]|nr:hypothetical protein [Candidatus Sumerlaeota bacterium]
MKSWKDIDWKDVWERVSWTFLQAFVGAFCLTVTVDSTTLFDLTMWKKALLSGLAGGVAAVISLIKNIFSENTAKKAE